MAILKMKKLRLMAVRSKKDELLRELIRHGCVEFSELEGEIQGSQLENLVSRESSDTATLKSQYTSLNHAIALLNTYAPKKEKMLSAKPELEDVVYYANETQLYAAPMANPAVAQLQYELPFGSTEKITAIKVYDFETGGQCMYEDVTSEGRKQERFLYSAHHMMMIITYDETTREGKIRCIPIKTLGLGGLEKNTAYHVTFSGFDQITGVYCQIGRGIVQ